MGRFRLFAGIALLVVGGLVVFSSYYIGGRIERRFAAVCADDASWASRTQLSCEEVEYNRGWFSSNVTTRITVHGTESPALLLRHSIRHGPLSMHKDYILGLARVQTVAQLEHGNGTSPLRTAFQYKTPLRATTYVSLGSSVRSRIHSPRDEWQSGDTEFAWGGMNGTVTLLRSSKKGMDLDFQFPRVEVEVPGQSGDVLVKDLRLSRSVRRDQQGAMLNGTAELRMERIEAHDSQVGEVSAESVVMTSQTGGSGGLLRSETQIGLKQGRLGEVAIDQGDFRMLLDNLDAEALRQWRTLLRQNPEEISDSQVRGIAERFLARSPRMDEAQLRVKTGEGEIRMDASAAFNGTGELSALNRPQMLKRLTAKAGLSVPVSIGVRIATVPVGFLQGLTAEQGSSPDREEMERRARDWLEKLRQLEYISRDSGRYAVSLELEEGLVSVNDKPVLPLGGVM
jgi:uncharacterized protein YdgA (DUF945 family)